MRRLPAPACKYLICMMMVMSMMSMTTTFLMVMAMVMRMAVTAAFLMVMVMLMTVMLVMTVTAASLMVMVMSAAALFIFFMVEFKQLLNLRAVFKSTHNRFFSQLLPRCGNNGCLCIFPSEHVHTVFHLFICHHLCPADYNRGCMFYLILKKFPKILKIHFGFLPVYNRDSS